MQTYLGLPLCDSKVMFGSWNGMGRRVLSHFGRCLSWHLGWPGRDGPNCEYSPPMRDSPAPKKGRNQSIPLRRRQLRHLSSSSRVSLIATSCDMGEQLWMPPDNRLQLRHVGAAGRVRPSRGTSVGGGAAWREAIERNSMRSSRVGAWHWQRGRVARGCHAELRQRCTRVAAARWR